MSNVSLVDGHIDEPKMTDEQIMKALECCCKKDCKRCPAYDEDIECGENTIILALDLINRKNAELEESQDAHIRTIVEKDIEIERLNKEVDRLSQVVMYGEAEAEENEAKLAHQAETIKILEQALSDRMEDIERLEHKCDDCAGCSEWKCDCSNIRAQFAERLAKKKQLALIANYYVYVVTVEDIDNLLKEMEGDNNV